MKQKARFREQVAGTAALVPSVAKSSITICTAICRHTWYTSAEPNVVVHTEKELSVRMRGQSKFQISAILSKVSRFYLMVIRRPAVSFATSGVTL